MDELSEKIEELLEKPYWVIDVLPEQVPPGSGGQYFAIEEYWLTEPRASALRQKQLDLILKLNCYRDIIADGLGKNPAPSVLSELIGKQRLNILTDGALIVTDPDFTHITVFDSDEALLRLIRPIAASEGLFLWQPRQGG